jgi:hypothetical protein
MMAQGTVESELHSLVTSAVNKVNSQPQILAASTPGKEPDAYWIKRWLGLRAGPDASRHERNLFHVHYPFGSPLIKSAKIFQQYEHGNNV